MADTVWLRSGTGVWEVEVGCEAHLHLLAGGADVVAGPDVEGYEALLKKDLVELCVELGLDAGGNKADLVGRLVEHDAAEPQPVDADGDPLETPNVDPDAPGATTNPDGSPA